MPRTRGPKDLLSSKECDALPVGRHHDGAGLYLVVNETRKRCSVTIVVVYLDEQGQAP